MLFDFKLKNLAFAVILLFAMVGCDLNDDDTVVPPNITIANFVDTNANYSSLNAALEATGLKSVVADPAADLTVFAPDNAAFSAFLSDNGFSGLNAVPEDVLEQLLLNHVLNGINLAADLNTGYVENLSTATPDENNMSLFISTAVGVELNGMSTVTNPDIIVDNGVIHAVDAVIALPDVTTFVTADPTFEILVNALTAYDDFGFVEILQSIDSPAPFTVFGPTNDAFMALLAELEISSLDDIPQDLLARVLSYHVVTEANVRSGDLSDGMPVTTFEGGTFTVNVSGSAVTITDERGRTSNVVLTDVQARNGVIHVIDTVLLPEQQD
jgi:transforming growth factor-beta-induced protein